MRTQDRMMKGALFFLIVAGIALVLWYTPVAEAFQSGSLADGAGSPGLNIPLISPRDQTIINRELKAFAPSATELLAPPPGQIASVNSLPATDPQYAKPPAARIQSVYESLLSFFRNEEPGLSKLGDPAVQLPLSTARSDRARLKDELEVLARNPGLESSLSTEDLSGIEANLAYLEKKWRLSVNSGAVSPMPPAAGTEEGFVSLGSTQNTSWWRSLFSTLPAEGAEGFQAGGSNPASNVASNVAGRSDVVKKDLEDLALRINIEILKLQSSGTTDLTVTARITNLTKALNFVNDFLADVNKGEKSLREFPMTKAEIARYLVAMQNPNTPLPEILAQEGLSSFLNSLFPFYSAGDVSGAQLSQKLFTEYSKTMLNNLSWDVNLSYKAEAEKEIAKNYADAMLYGKFAAEQEAEAAKAGLSGTGPLNETTKNAYRGMFESIIKDLAGKGGASLTGLSMSAPGGTTGGGGGEGGEGGAGTSDAGGPLNWKERVGHICTQIKKRDMDPLEFGCLANPEGEKYQGFSWRGHTRMVCNRLQTVYDPSVPELCGCPPPTWPGWRS